MTVSAANPFLAAEAPSDPRLSSVVRLADLERMARERDVLAAVGGRIETWVDGGIRRGSEIALALALGARGVLIGRPALWGLAVAGEAGVARVLAILREELEITMALLGAPSVDHLRPDRAVRVEP